MDRNGFRDVSCHGKIVTHSCVALDDRCHRNVPPSFSTVECARGREPAAAAGAGGRESCSCILAMRSRPPVEPVGAGNRREVADTLRTLSVCVYENDTAAGVEYGDAVGARFN
jgi:hypothetical protein